MTKVDLARLQFATTSLYHFLFVPLTMGMAWLTAIMQTAWRHTGNDDWLRLTRFFGRILLISVVVGVATGLVQEFQFGMNWSAYSRFVGDVFGAPLAIEGLAAFFLESTFLGIWYFGWNRLSPRLHLATIYVAAVGTMLSAVFILAANAWMQHPSGHSLNEATGRAQLENIGALFTNKIFLWSVPHTLFAALVTASGVLLAVSCWHLLRSRQADIFRRSALLGLVVLFPATGLALMTGARLAITITELQPMKTASMEALWNTEEPAAFSLFQIGGMTEEDQTPTLAIEIPNLLSVLATNDWNGKVEGMNQVQADEVDQYGEGSYIPIVPLSYWGLRVMAYLGMWILLVSGVGLVLAWRRKLDVASWFLRVAIWSAVAPFLINLGGWILTEAGRQPWIVWGLLRTADATSPNVSAGQVAFTLGSFLVLYAALTFTAWWWIVRYGRRDLDPVDSVAADLGEGEGPAPDIPVMSY